MGDMIILKEEFHKTKLEKNLKWLFPPNEWNLIAKPQN